MTSAPETSTPEDRWAPLDADRARALAEWLHRGQRDAGGALVIDHVRRVAAAVPHNARVVAWLHEVLEHTSTSEEALLAEGLSNDELRAIRLLSRDIFSRSHASYLGHVAQIASAEGPGAATARTVKRADLSDRMAHPPLPRYNSVTVTTPRKPIGTDAGWTLDDFRRYVLEDEGSDVHHVRSTRLGRVRAAIPADVKPRLRAAELAPSRPSRAAGSPGCPADPSRSSCISAVASRRRTDGSTSTCWARRPTCSGTSQAVCRSKTEVPTPSSTSTCTSTSPCGWVRARTESRRVLRPGGILRIGVPDAGALLDSYSGAGASDWALSRPTPMLAVQALFYEHGHLAMYDAETLKWLCEAAGFRDVRASASGEGRLTPSADSADRRDGTCTSKASVLNPGVREGDGERVIARSTSSPGGFGPSTRSGGARRAGPRRRPARRRPLVERGDVRGPERVPVALSVARVLAWQGRGPARSAARCDAADGRRAPSAATPSGASHRCCGRHGSRTARRAVPARGGPGSRRCVCSW